MLDFILINVLNGIGSYLITHFLLHKYFKLSSITCDIGCIAVFSALCLIVYGLLVSEVYDPVMVVKRDIEIDGIILIPTAVVWGAFIVSVVYEKFKQK